MKRLSRNELEIIGERVIRAYMKLPELKGQAVYRICPDVLVKSLLGLQIDYRHLSVDGTILGLTSFEKIGVELPKNKEDGGIYYLDGKTILIESDLKDNLDQVGRRNFTITHEASHQILKMLFPSDYGEKPYEKAVHFCRADTIRKKTISDWEEWQSNVLGAAILLPRYLVEQAMCLFGIKGKIRILNKLFAREDYERFVGMTKLLGCSKTALAIRMKRFGYIEKDYLDNPYKMLEVEVD